MTIHRIERTQWQPYFDYISRLLNDEQAEVEVARLPISDRVHCEWTRLNRLMYHPKDDILHVTTDGADHRIAHPKDIYVDDAGTTLLGLDVIDGDGNHQIVQLREPMPLAIPQ